MRFPVIKYFDHEEPVVFSMLRGIPVSKFEHLGITSWDNIDKKRVYFEQLPIEPETTKLINYVLSWKDIANDDTVN